MKILIVEDNADSRTYLERALKARAIALRAQPMEWHGLERAEIRRRT